jgi:hypothetical protein
MKRLLLFAILLSAVSCVYDYENPAIEGAGQLLVFDGDIVIGSRATLSVSRITPTAGKGATEAVSLSNWWVEDEDGTVYNVDVTGTVEMFGASPDKSYKMVAICDGKTYSSPLQAPIKAPQLDSLVFTSDGNTVYCNLSFQADTTVTKYVALSFEERWQFHTPFEKSFDIVSYYNKDSVLVTAAVELDFPDLSHYWCWTHRKATTDALVEMSSLGGKAVDFPINLFSTSSNRNHRQYEIKVFARSLSEKEYRFSHSLASQDGGLNLFTPNPGEIVGNVVCEDDPREHVFGYVSTSSVSSIKRNLNSRYLKITTPSTSDLIVPSPTVDISWYIDLGLWPVARIQTIDGTPIGWGEMRCIDCIAAGGTLERPDFDK